VPPLKIADSHALRGVFAIAELLVFRWRLACEICTQTYNSEFFDSINADSSDVTFQHSGVYRHF